MAFHFRSPFTQPSKQEEALHDVNVRMELTPAGENYYLRFDPLPHASYASACEG